MSNKQNVVAGIYETLPGGQGLAREQESQRNTKSHPLWNTEIVLNTLVLTIPMLILSGVLLGLVYNNTVSEDYTISGGKPLLRVDRPADFYYVDTNASRLVFIASWCSTLAPLLSVCMIGLWSFPVAARFREASHESSSVDMLTPHQLNLTIDIFSGGGIGSIWRWLKYVCQGKKQRQPQGRVLASTASMLIFATCLGIPVFLADTWLHVSTETVPFFYTIDDPENHFSYPLSVNCTKGDNSWAAQESSTNLCSLQITANSARVLAGSDVIRVLSNQSQYTDPLIYRKEDDSIENFDGSHVDKYVYLGPGDPFGDDVSTDYIVSDWTANTFGAHTSCSFITQKCNTRNDTGTNVTFACSDDFKAELKPYSKESSIMFFPNSSMISDSAAAQNPFYAGLAFLANSQTANNSPYFNESDVVQVADGGEAWVLLCESTLYDIEYDWINGTVTRFDTTPSNASVSIIPRLTLGNTTIAQRFLETAADLATLSFDLQDSMALSLSTAIIAALSPATTRAPAKVVQRRYSFLVARVSVAALWTLVVANMLFVIAGIALFLLALRAGGSDVEAVQSKLSIGGLVEDRFRAGRGDETEDVYGCRSSEPDVRVAIRKTSEGRYAYEETCRELNAPAITRDVEQDRDYA